MLCPGSRRTAHRRIESSASLEIEETLNRRMQSQNKTGLNVMRHYYVARSESVQDGWIQTLRCDWLTDGAILPARDYPLCTTRTIPPKAM